MNKAIYKDRQTKRIAALTIARNADRFIERWIAHYGAAFGHENLYVIFDGMDQKLPHSQNALQYHDVNILNYDFVPFNRLKGDKTRAARASDFARDLFQSYDMVIGTDVDEFLVLDPQSHQSLAHYLSARPTGSSLSALGVDVARNQTLEAPLDWTAPFLGQRGFGLLSDRYTKACIITRPVRWGSGFHRVKGHRFRIDPNLFLFHFGSVDTQEINARFEDAERVSNGWTSHQKRRASLSDKITSANPVDGDSRFPTARTSLSRARSLFAWNKPRPLKRDDVVKIPTRFYGVV